MKFNLRSFVAAAAACHLMTAHAAPAADAIYVGGDIVTLNDQQPNAQALAVKDGKILAVGERKKIEADHKGAGTRVVDLKGKALLPGFIDAHSHYFSSLTVANQCNLYAPPAGPAKDVPAIVATIKKFAADRKIPAGEVIQCYGYDENVMPQGRLLNRDDLDKVSADNPVLVGHVSMHGAVLNSAAMKKWNFSAATETPPGGVIVRKPGTNEPYGLIMEMAYLPVFASLPQADRGAGDRMGDCRPEALCRRRCDDRARRCHPCRRSGLAAARSQARRLHHRRDCVPVHHRS